MIVGDITYLPLQNGRFCYLACFQDKFTRRIVGWQGLSKDDGATRPGRFEPCPESSFDKARSDYSHRSRKSICERGISSFAIYQRVSAINVGEGKLLQ